jgi:hypothetical protein
MKAALIASAVSAVILVSISLFSLHDTYKKSYTAGFHAVKKEPLQSIKPVYSTGNPDDIYW